MIFLSFPTAILIAIPIAYLRSYKKPEFSLKTFIISGLISLVAAYVSYTIIAFAMFLILYLAGSIEVVYTVLFYLSFIVTFASAIVIFVSLQMKLSEMISKRMRNES